MTDKNKIFDKIKKCLALSKSSNQHEAQAALRQAQKLMEANNISESVLLASSVGSSFTKAKAKATPSRWESSLAGVVAKAFGCDSFFSPTPHYGSYWVFVGIKPSPEIAEYAMQVLMRQITRDRKAYIEMIHGNTKRSRKTELADMFCMGWVRSAYEQIHVMARTKEQEEALKAYYNARNNPKDGEFEARDRSTGKKLSSNDIQAFRGGLEVGKTVRLHHGVNGKEDQLRIDHVAT